METFTPLTSLLGGVLIGISASALLLFNGRIAGISGIVAGLLGRFKEETLWRALFVAGLLAGGVLLDFLSPQVFEISVVRSLGGFGIAGFLVGFGTSLGSGCTSGHGVCGISRGSTRSFVATVTFMAAGALTTYIANHVIGGAP